MLVANLTSYGQSVVSTHVTIDGIILLSEYISNIDSANISSYTTLLDIEACGNLNKSIGYVKVEDDSKSVYQAHTLLFYSLSDSIKNIIAGCSQEDPIVNKMQPTLNIQLPVDLSCFTNGFTFSSIHLGYHIASDGIVGIVHIDDPHIESDDSYSVYSKTQVDELVSSFVESSDIPTNISAFNNDAGYITEYTETDPTVPEWAKASLKPSYTLDEVSDGSTRKLSDYVTTNTDQFITCQKTFVTGNNGVDAVKLAFGTYAQHYNTVAGGAEWNDDFISPYFTMSFIGNDGDISTRIKTKATFTHDQLNDNYNLTDIVSTSEVNNTWSLGSYRSTLKSVYINEINSAYTNAISFSVETTFNKNVDLVLAKDTNTYIFDDTLYNADSLMVDYEFDDSGDNLIGLRISLGSDNDNASWSKLILLSELETVTPVGELVYVSGTTDYDSYYTISQTNITISLKTMLEQSHPDPGHIGLYIVGAIDNPTTLGVSCGMHTDYSDNALLFVITVSEFSLDSYAYSPQNGEYIVINNNSTYSISNDYIRCFLSIPFKLSMQEYVATTSHETAHIIANSIVNNFASTLDSSYVTLHTEQAITGNKTFNSNVYIPTSASSNLYVTGYDDGDGIRFGDYDTSVSYPMIVGETRSSTKCDLRQNYYVNNTLAGTIQTQCDSDGNLLTTSGLGRSSSTTGKWSLGTSDYRLNAVYADNFHGDLSGNAATATTATTADTAINALNADNATAATTATTATFSQYIKYSTSTNYPMYASSSTVLRPTLNSSVDIGTNSYKYKNVYADFYNGFPIIPFGTCESDPSADKVVTLSPVPPSLTTGMIICVQFNSTNTKSSPTLNVNGLGAKAMWRTSTDQIGTNIATSWPSGSRVLFRYSGSTWSMISKVDYQTSTASNTNILPSTDNTYNIGSTDYMWKYLYITGGNSSHYIVIDNSGGEPTIRPDTSNYGYLGSSSYHWYRSYINTLYLGSSAVQIPPIAATPNTTLGSIQFLRVAIPVNTTTGIVSAGTALSSSAYTLMLVTASTNVSSLIFKNNTEPSGTWTTLTDMYYYNSGSSLIYTYVLAYKSA